MDEVENRPNLNEQKVEICEELKGRDKEISERNLVRAKGILESINVAISHEDGRDKRRRFRQYLDRFLGFVTKKDETIEQKKDRFKEFYKKEVFGTVIHAVSKKIGDSEEIELKSPDQLGFSTHSGFDDKEIGNTNYVFASAETMRSNSSLDRGVDYVIESRDCFVVPIDYAHVKGNEEDGSLEEYDLDRLRKYSRNMFTHEDFEEYFALYNAALFESPQQALEFYDKYKFTTDYADFLQERILSFIQDPKDKEIFARIQNLYRQDVLPPFSPEFQFEDRVKGKIRVS